MENKKIIALMLAGIFVVGGSSFYGGVQYASRKNVLRDKQNIEIDRKGAFGQGDKKSEMSRSGGGPGMMRMASGEIISKDDKSFTVKSEDGGLKIIFYSDKTDLVRASSTSANDIEIGKKVIINGKINPDGSVDARNVQIKTE